MSFTSWLIGIHILGNLPWMKGNIKCSLKQYHAILTTPTKYSATLVKSFPSDWYGIPLLKTGAFASTGNLFLQVDNERTQKNWHMHDQLLLLAAILDQWQRSVASSEALDLLYWAMHGVSYRCIAMAIKMASNVGVCVCHHFVCCCPGNLWGNTEQVVTWWRHPVASGVALDMPLQAMPSVLLQHFCMAIKKAHDRGAFVFSHHLFCLT